jgi:hypothetical protein
LPLKSPPGGWSPGWGKVSIQESGARLEAPQRNAIIGFGDRKAIEIPVVLIPQAESLSVNSDKQSDMFQRVSLLPRGRFLFYRRAALIAPTPDREPGE